MKKREKKGSANEWQGEDEENRRQALEKLIGRASAPTSHSRESH